MTDYKHGATAQVQLTLEVEVRSSWGGDCTVAQVHNQAEKEAKERIYGILQETKSFGAIRILGHPKVTAVLATREYK